MAPPAALQGDTLRHARIAGCALATLDLTRVRGFEPQWHACLYAPAVFRAGGIALSIAQTVSPELRLREVRPARCGTGLAAIANQVQARRCDEYCMSSSGDITV